MSRPREEQDLMDGVILTALKRGHVSWMAFEKKVLTMCHHLATRTRFDNRLRYLLKHDYREGNKITGSNLKSHSHMYFLSVS